MSSVIACPSCQKSVEVPVDFTGKMVECPLCRAAFLAEAPPAKPDDREERQTKARRPRPGYDDDFDEAYDDLPRRRYDERIPDRGSTIFSLGLVSLGLGFFLCPLLFLGPFVWHMANQDLWQMRNGIMDPRGEANTVAGRTMAIVSSCLAAFLAAILIIFGLASVFFG